MNIEEYDLQVLRNKEAEAERRKEAEAERRHARVVQRWKTLSATAGWASAAAAVIGVAYVVWQGVAGPSAEQQMEDAQKRECIAASGTWVPLYVGDSRSSYTCIFGEAR